MKIKVLLVVLLFGHSKSEEYQDLIEGIFTAKEDDNCTCVPFYFCKDGLNYADNTAAIDIRSPGTTCENFLEVCCQSQQIYFQPIKSKLATTTRQPGCGYSNPYGVGFRISDGAETAAQFGEFPWMAAVLQEEKVGDSVLLYIYKCGGSLVHERVVLTAAHCLNPDNVYKVRVGEWDTRTTNELVPHQDILVKKIVLHPKYHSGALINDVALLVLEQPAEMADSINVICLPPPEVPLDYTKCLSSGWGKDSSEKGSEYHSLLKKIPLKVVPSRACEKKLKGTRLGTTFKLHRSFICAEGRNGRDTCKGDGGSPLICPVNSTSTVERDRYYQIGLVSWGIGCGNTVPGVYVNVVQYKNWIEEIIKKYSY